MTIFDQISTRIVKEQELIIGPLAWEEAKKIAGIHVNGKEIALEGNDPKEVINRLISQYEYLFGRASHEVCREAVQDLIAEMPPEEVPSSLK